MAKQSVNTALPIEFSEVCEVVYQDLLGTNGRSLTGSFAQAIIQGGTFNNGPGRDSLQDFVGYALQYNPGPTPSFISGGPLIIEVSRNWADIPYPTTIAGDLILLVLTAESTTTITTPVGFSELYSVSIQGISTYRTLFNLFYKIANGSEPTHLNLIKETVPQLGGIMYSFRGINTSNIFDQTDMTYEVYTNNLVVSANEPSTGINRLAVGIVMTSGVGTDNLISVTPGNWSLSGRHTDSDGSFVTTQLVTQSLPTVGTFGGNTSVNLVQGRHSVCFTMQLIPANI